MVLEKYKMNVYEIRRKLVECENLYADISSSNNSSVDLDIVDNLILHYRSLLENFNIKKQGANLFCSDNDYHYANDKELIDDLFFRDFDCTDCEIDEKIINLYKTFQDFFSNEPLIIDPINFTNDDLISLMEEIIRSTESKRFITYYEEARKRTKFHIQYVKKDFSMKGCCFFNQFDPDIFNLLYRDNSSEDIVTSVHEMFHAIIIYYLSEIVGTFCYGKSPYVNEVEGYLADFIAVDYLRMLKYADNLILDNIYDVMSNAKSMMLGLLSYDNLDKYGNINLGRVNAMLLQGGIKNADITTCNKQQYVSHNFLNSTTNNCSFLAACDLFELYKIDKEKAIYNLLKISELNPSNVVSGLRKHGITFMDDDFASFKKISNKLLEKKID